MILVTGPNGNIGRPLVRSLLDAGVRVRLAVRDRARADDHGGRAELAAVDLDRPETLAPALVGVRKLVMIAPGPNVPAQDAAMIAAAQGAAVEHVVMVSSLGAELGGIAGGRPHMPGEAALRESGLAWTILHPSEFMSNTLRWAPMIQSAGSVFAPSGDGRIGMIDPADIAAVAAKVLTTSGHEGRVYRLTGPAAVSLADMAATLASVLGRPVRHVDVPDAAYRESLAQLGMPPFVIEMMSEYYAAVRAGRVGVVYPDVRALLGREARTYEQWARDHAAAFRATAAA